MLTALVPIYIYQQQILDTINHKQTPHLHTLNSLLISLLSFFKLDLVFDLTVSNRAISSYHQHRGLGDKTALIGFR